jgi:hypothetical protein
MDLISIGVTISYCATSTGTFKKIYGVESIGQIKVEPQTITLPRLSEPVLKRVVGVQDNSQGIDVVFGLNLDPSYLPLPEIYTGTEWDFAPYVTLSAVPNNTTYYFKVSDGKGWSATFPATFFVSEQEIQHNSERKATLKLYPANLPTEIFPTA